ASVRWSTVRWAESRASMAAKICACAALAKSSGWTIFPTSAIAALSARTAPSTARSAARSSWARVVPCPCTAASGALVKKSGLLRLDVDGDLGVHVVVQPHLHLVRAD